MSERKSLLAKGFMVRTANLFRYDQRGWLVWSVRRYSASYRDDLVESILSLVRYYGSGNLLYSLRYDYYDLTLNNRLKSIFDAVSTQFPHDLESQPSVNYLYDPVGNMVRDMSRNLSVRYNYSNRPKLLTLGNNTIRMLYNPAGYRFFKGTDERGEVFIYNTQGQLMAKYRIVGDTLRLDFLPIYEGTRRLGIYEPEGVEWVAGSGKFSLLSAIHVLPCLNCPMQLTRVKRYALKPTRKYELTDHLGNVRVVIADQRMAVADSSGQVVAYYKPKVLSIHDYYPYGWQKFSAFYPFGANAGSLKEGWDSTGGTYYTLYRVLDARLGRWYQVEPVWEEYAMWSGYVVGMGNPVVFVDPFGEDTIRIGRNGKLVEYKEAKGDDVFIVVDDGGGEVARLVLPENTLLGIDKWTRSDLKKVDSLYRKIFKSDPDMIKEYFEGIGRSGELEVSKYIYIYKIRGDRNARRLFEFLADHTDVEWGLWATGKEGPAGLNFITTTSLYRREYGGMVLYMYQLQFGYYLRFHVHKHPTDPYPSRGDVFFKHEVLKNIMARYPSLYGFLPIPRFAIYVPSSYVVQDKISGFEGRYLYYEYLTPTRDRRKLLNQVNRRYIIRSVR